MEDTPFFAFPIPESTPAVEITPVPVIPSTPAVPVQQLPTALQSPPAWYQFNSRTNLVDYQVDVSTGVGSVPAIRSMSPDDFASTFGIRVGPGNVATPTFATQSAAGVGLPWGWIVGGLLAVWALAR